MQTGMNFSSLKASYTTTHWSALGEEIKNDKANSVPTTSNATIKEKDEGSKASNVVASNEVSNNKFGDLHKQIVSHAIEKIAEIKNDIMKIWEELYGQDRPTSSIDSIKDITDLISGNITTRPPIQIGGSQSGISITQGFYQSLELSIKGTIVGQDGVKKELDLSISISQSFIQNIQINGSNSGNGSGSIVDKEEGAEIIDPLVIDYEGNGTELSDTTMSFDLDSDGKEDQISTLKKGSGFLALDKNNDGKINDGNELFGTQSGDGFKDLAQYDSNKDGKIDKNDPIYNKLRIWSPNEKGEGELVGLGEKGIGVIYLDAKDDKEYLMGEKGDLLGIKQKTSDFIRDDGSSGNIHHIDLVKDPIKSQQQNEQILNSMLNGNSLLGSKAYLENLSFSASWTETNFASASISSNGNGGFNWSFSSATYKSFSFSFSLDSLHNATNGVSADISNIWKKLEESFKDIESIGSNNQPNSGLVDLLLKRFDEANYSKLNELLFNSSKSESPFKNNLNLQELARLIS